MHFGLGAIEFELRDIDIRMCQHHGAACCGAFNIASRTYALTGKCVQKRAFAGAGAADDADDQYTVEVEAELIESARDASPQCAGAIHRRPCGCVFDPAAHAGHEPIEFGEAKLFGPVVS